MLVSRVPWPLEKGDKLRAYNQLKVLAQNHEVFLCCLNDQNYSPEAYQKLRELTPHVLIVPLSKWRMLWQFFKAFFNKTPFQVHYFYQHKASKIIRKAIDNFQPDHIYCQLIRTAEYVKHLHQYSKTIDYMDALSAGMRRRLITSSIWLKPFIREEALRLNSYENLIFDYFDSHTIISEQDKQLILHENRNKIEVIPNGVNAVFFQPQPQPKLYDLAFTGNMSYPPNIDCALRIAHEILPLVHRTHPEVKLLIAGANPTTTIRQLAGSNITITGWLDDMRSAYNQSKIFLAPMRIGSGLQNKLLEAMCMNLPCITTPLAARPMNIAPNFHLLVEDSNEEIASKITYLLNHPDKAKEIANRGRDYVLSHFNWENSVEQLTQLFESSHHPTT